MLQRPRTAMAGALACGAALTVTGIVSHLVPAGETLDAGALEAFTRVRAHDVDGVLAQAVHFGDPLPYLLLGAAIVVAAVARHRPRLAAIVGVVLLAAPLTTELLKLATAQARERSVAFADHISNASWPSGHATGAMTLALCAVLVAPPRLRPAVAMAGGLLALVVGYAVIALVWHFPSDVVGAYLLSAGWAMAGVAASRRWPDAPAAEPRSSPGAATAVTFAAAAAIGAVAVRSYRPGTLLDHASDHPELAVSAAGIAALAVVLAAALVRSARSS